MLFRLLFDWFFWSYALAGGVAVGALLTAAGSLAGHPIPGATVLVTGAAAAGIFRLSLLVNRRDPARLGAFDRLGRFVGATAFAFLAAAGALGITTLGWWFAARFGTNAEAGSVLAATAAGGRGIGFAVTSATSMAASVLLVAYGYRFGYRNLRVREHTLVLDGLARASRGIRLVHVSDLHLGAMADVALVREAVARVNALDADLVCVTGDIVDNPSTDLERWLPELSALAARHGVLAILGNHDRHSGAERVTAALARHTSWRVLRDASTTLDLGGARLHVIGLEDRRGRDSRPALAKLLAAAPAETPIIVLAHYPHTFAVTAAAGVPLTLAGHTHGGQVALPGLPRVNPARLLMTRHDGGLFADGGAALHVSRGLGTGCQPLRIGVPPEITLLTLVPGDAARAA